ncbi:MAG: MBL fold metallo-hydrolase [Candidatus Lokiarchaeota archaeon]|nr:MBL fold metallo-hydrolase [Candidatus Lokiarchaeota archaeon]
MKEVYPGIFLIKEKGTFGAIKPPENIYVLAGSDGIIFDAGYGTKKAVKHFIRDLKKVEEYYKEQNKEFKLTRILVSHCHPDHFSGLKRIREALGIPISLTKKSAEIIKDKKSFIKSFETDAYEDYLRVRKKITQRIINVLRNVGSRLFYQRIYGVSYIDDPEEILDNNTELIINGEVWQIFPSPGHAIDHISLYNKEKGILFSGDNILRSITTWLGPPNCEVVEYINSIETIQKLPNLKLIFAAHGSPIENPKERITEILSHRKEREKQVLNIIYDNSYNGISPKDIIKTIYPKDSRFLHQVARGWIVLTLKMLEGKNLIKRQDTKKKILFFPAEKH